MESLGAGDYEDLKKIVASGITPEALECLDRLFPEKTPEVSDSIDQIRHAGGQRSVIRFLRSLKSLKHGS